jgi:hypothetical protein
MSSSSSTTTAAATAEDENENANNINKENTPPQSSQASTSIITPTRTPILTERIYMGSGAEDDMIDQIDAVIRRLLTRPNHQSPYRYNFEWTVDEEPDLNYSVLLCIREPSIHI